MLCSKCGAKKEFSNGECWKCKQEAYQGRILSVLFEINDAISELNKTCKEACESISGFYESWKDD